MKTIATALKPADFAASSPRRTSARSGCLLDLPIGAHALGHFEHVGVKLLGLHDLLGEDTRAGLVADAQRIRESRAW